MKKWGIFIICWLSINFLIIEIGQSATLDVCESQCTYPTIQSAVNAATDGDTIIVSGLILENDIMITKGGTLTIEGSTTDPADTVIDACLDGMVDTTSPCDILNPCATGGVCVDGTCKECSTQPDFCEAGQTKNFVQCIKDTLNGDYCRKRNGDGYKVDCTYDDLNTWLDCPGEDFCTDYRHSRVFFIDPQGQDSDLDLTIKNLTIINGKTPEIGYPYPTPYVEIGTGTGKYIFVDTLRHQGGGIFADNISGNQMILRLENNEIAYNQSLGKYADGGGVVIANDKNSVEAHLIGNKIYGNFAEWDSGGVLFRAEMYWNKVPVFDIYMHDNEVYNNSHLKDFFGSAVNVWQDGVPNSLRAEFKNNNIHDNFVADCDRLGNNDRPAGNAGIGFKLAGYNEFLDGTYDPVFNQPDITFTHNTIENNYGAASSGVIVMLFNDTVVDFKSYGNNISNNSVRSDCPVDNPEGSPRYTGGGVYIGAMNFPKTFPIVSQDVSKFLFMNDQISSNSLNDMLFTGSNSALNTVEIKSDNPSNLGTKRRYYRNMDQLQAIGTNVETVDGSMDLNVDSFSNNDLSNSSLSFINSELSLTSDSFTVIWEGVLDGSGSSPDNDRTTAHINGTGTVIKDVTQYDNCTFAAHVSDGDPGSVSDQMGMKIYCFDLESDDPPQQYALTHVYDMKDVTEQSGDVSVTVSCWNCTEYESALNVIQTDNSDSDQDGIPDDYEMIFGVDLERYGDYDGDGLYDSDEYAFHSDPTRTDTDANTIIDLIEWCSNADNPVRIVKAGQVVSYHTSLQIAYDSAASAGDIIQSLAINFSGNQDLNANDQNKSVSFEPGYDCDYSSNTGVTTLN